MKKESHPTDVVLDGRRNPVDRVAARVVQQGVHWRDEAGKGGSDSVNPIPYFDVREWFQNSRGTIPNLTGMVVGTLTVLGFAGNKRWVLRCACGYYTKRSTKAIRNPANKDDCCSRCRQKQYHTRRQEFLNYGRNR